MSDTTNKTEMFIKSGGMKERKMLGTLCQIAPHKDIIIRYRFVHTDRVPAARQNISGLFVQAAGSVAFSLQTGPSRAGTEMS